jgi:hypothetical protein
MNPKQYEQNVLITESNNFLAIRERMDDRMLRLLHVGLGLSSELEELTNAYADSKNQIIDWVNVAEESSDLLWYCTVAVNALGFDHDEVSSFENEVNGSLVEKHSEACLRSALLSAVCVTGQYNDILKKHLLYGRELNVEKIKKVLQALCLAVSGLCFISGTTISDARRTNINKLKARYGEKFTEAAALNRDLETERKILEDGVK